jgi:site-specific DNA-methyltransferase (adenine-specific)
MGEKTPDTPAGRWPANVIHDGSDEVLALFPESKGQLAASRSDGEDKTQLIYGKMKHNPVVMQPRGDSGSAARFFYCAKVSTKERNEGLEHLPDREWSSDGAAVPERANRPFNPSKNNHPTLKPIALMRYLCRLVTPPGGTILDPWMGSGSTGKAAKLEGFDFIGMEQDADYFRIAQARCGVEAFNEEDFWG